MSAIDFVYWQSDRRREQREREAELERLPYPMPEPGCGDDRDTVCPADDVSLDDEAACPKLKQKKLEQTQMGYWSKKQSSERCLQRQNDKNDLYCGNQHPEQLVDHADWGPEYGWEDVPLLCGDDWGGSGGQLRGWAAPEVMPTEDNAKVNMFNDDTVSEVSSVVQI